MLDLAQQLLAGNKRALARTLTHIQNETAEATRLLAAIYPHTGQAHLIGITGAPGTGKSSLVNALAHHYRMQEQTVGIIAVDPTSPFSGGAVLGDRIRMHDLAGDPGVFIRSMATRGSLGGLARTTGDAIRALDAAGFDIILIETVGAGQSEVDIAREAYTTLVVEAPGMGDDVQAIKAGILEIADILVVNKADRPETPNTKRALQAMLDLGSNRPHDVWQHTPLLPALPQTVEPAEDRWQPPIIETIATQSTGIEQLITAITRHRDYLQHSGSLTAGAFRRMEAEIAARLQAALLERFLLQTDPARLSDVIAQAANRTIAPHQAVAALLDSMPPALRLSSQQQES